jgi:unsaturated rhamnogalacturonyl hydrolase
LAAVAQFSCATAPIKSSVSSRGWATAMSASLMQNLPDTIYYRTTLKSARWDYERGVVLEGLYQIYQKTGDKKYLVYIKKQIDQYISEDGSIATYDYNSFNLDNIATGRTLLELFKETGDKRYKIAADTLRSQLAHQPRTHEGGFWHKKIYPYQMWLDGLYMAEPFYAHYAQMVHDSAAFDDIANQFIFIENHVRDPKTGLLYHGWDESKQQKWANPKTGCSPNFWGRAVGWYVWAIVDVLDYFPANHPKRAELISILQRTSKALVDVRDAKSHLWYQVLDQGNRQGNYFEASGSCMFVYAFAKGATKGYLDTSYRGIANESFKSIVDSMVTVKSDGTIDLRHTCQGAGLGGNPYRDASYNYYIGEAQRTNDFKGIGPFIVAALALEKY